MGAGAATGPPPGGMVATWPPGAASAPIHAAAQAAVAGLDPKALNRGIWTPAQVPGVPGVEMRFEPAATADAAAVHAATAGAPPPPARRWRTRWLWAAAGW